MTTPHESRPAKIATCTGRLISAICANTQRVAREVLARAGQQEGAQISAPADVPTPEARDGFGVWGACRITYHLMS